ncbi:MAG: outer membrane lipid asymmetry maintenance protein MlaD [Pseudomonadota bacterium]
MKHSLFETAVGALVLIVAGTFFFYGAQRSDLSGGGGYTLSAKFGRIDGLAVGADVRLAGVKVGTVARQSLDTATYEAAVDMTINSGVPIPEDSVAKVTLDGLLGGAYVSIEPGGSDLYLEPGQSFSFTQGSVDLIGLASRAVLGGPGTDE